MILTLESRGRAHRIVEVLEYKTTTHKSPTPSVRLIMFLAEDGKKYVTTLRNPGLMIKESL